MSQVHDLMMVSQLYWKVRGFGVLSSRHAPHMTRLLSVRDSLQVSAAMHDSDWQSPMKVVYADQ